MKLDMGGGITVPYDGRKQGICPGCGCITIKKTNEYYKYMRTKLNKGLLCGWCIPREIEIVLDGKACAWLESICVERQIKYRKGKQ